MVEKKRGLGRGLDQLLPSSDWLKRDDIQLFYCALDRLTPNPYQPRKTIEDHQLAELTESIREKGVLQPILVTRTETADHYQILAGERRWQAAQRAGLREVPVILRETSSPEALELALIENIQRTDLNCIEEALAYQRLYEEFHLTHEQIAQRVGKNRSTITNLLRLLQLPREIQEDILNAHLSMGHARALLALTDPDQQLQMRDLILARNLSVRQTEQLLAKPSSARAPAQRVNSHWEPLQEALQTHLETRVRLRRKGQSGSITIAFDSDDHLQQVLKRLGLQELAWQSSAKPEEGNQP